MLEQSTATSQEPIPNTTNDRLLRNFAEGALLLTTTDDALLNNVSDDGGSH
jgi:hypothetical protein